MQIPQPRRPWYQFSLRTMFVLVVVVSIPLAWVGYSLNWIRQRREVRNRGISVRTLRDQPCIVSFSIDGDTYCTAPAGLWLFGEMGFSEILVWGDDKCVADTKLLFPEATIHHWPL